MINVGWFKGGTVFVNYNGLCRRSTDVFGGSTTCAVNNCFSSLIYYFIGRIKCTLPCILKICVCGTDDRYKHPSHSLAFGSPINGLYVFKKFIIFICKVPIMGKTRG